MMAVLEDLPATMQARLVRRGMPTWTAPMLAVLTDKRFSSDEWLYERKLDGERCLVFRDGRGVRLRSRNKKNLNSTYPELVDALSKAGPDRFIADGEIVAFEGKVTSFSRLQQRIGIVSSEKARASDVKVFLYLFDLLYLDGFDLDELPLKRRKSVLRRVIRFGGPLRFTPHRMGGGEAYFAAACRKGWEGIIAKKADSVYTHRRSPDWLKFKCVNRQELVIGGFTDPGGSRTGFGALLVGYYDGRRLRYAGKVGTGFDDKTLRSLRQRMDRLVQDKSPFDGEIREKGAHWVRPRLVAEVGFSEWTRDGKLRHPRFFGLRNDKAPGKVVRERSRHG